ncbi:glycoside hydrolase family 25 protein [Streptococcus loxodontisalivarius]|uniref:Lysozyme n=1 Tax=Streptococcus loxodontisalivarius TaxID=1349415 RepID=A0ABS2PRC9_9STRE|nr:glycoside hydrolase family 25 protein [Streptococcus loxodontisalivarius]MBM7642545.1 lysozyme [Streptococcus loxodontisalivarius]
MRKRIKPPVVLVFFSLIGLLLIIANIYGNSVTSAQLASAKKEIPVATSTSTSTEESSSTETETFVLNPIIDLSGWQLPSEIDYDTLSQNISGAIVRVFGGSGITEDNNAASNNGVDKSFKTHIKEFQKRDVPVAVYAYTMGTSVEEMKEEAQIFYKNASPYNPTYYWIDVEEKTMDDMDAGVQAFLKELKRLGAEKVGIYIGTYFMEEHGISTDNFDAVWIPTYGSDSGYYESAPETTMDYDLHQYTSQGYINGFDGALDLNQIAVTKDTKETYEKLFGSVDKKSSK